MLLQYFGRRVARCKRFSPPDDVYFSIPSLRKFHPRTVWLEYKGTVQRQIRNRVKMSEKCCVVGRRCGSWEGLQKADRNVGGLRMKMKIREFVSGSPVSNGISPLFHIWEMIMRWMISRTEKFNWMAWGWISISAFCLCKAFLPVSWKQDQF